MHFFKFYCVFTFSHFHWMYCDCQGQKMMGYLCAIAVCVCVCVSVCLSVCLFVCLNSPNRWAEFDKIFHINLTEIAFDQGESQILKFRNWWLYGGRFVHFQSNTLTVAILLRFSHAVYKVFFLKISKMLWLKL